MKRYVIDASVAIRWLIQERGTDEANRLRTHRLLAPDLVRAECANVLWKKVRRAELTEQEAMLAVRLLAHSDIRLMPMRLLLEPGARFPIRLDHSARRQNERDVN